MDWNQTKSIAEADLGAIVSKVSSPRAALGSLEKKITAEVAKIEAYLGSLDGRALDLPGLLDQADQKVAKIQAVVAKADNDGRPDLKQAALGRLAKEEADRKALQDELDGLDQAQTVADEWLSKLQDKLVEVQAKIDTLPPDPKPAAAAPSEPAPAPAPAPAPSKAPAKAAAKDDDVDLASLDALVASAPKPAPTPKAAAPAPAAQAKAPAAKPAAGAKAGKGDALDDEFAALFAELNVDPSQVELPKKKAPPKIEVDDKIPDLVMVKDDELPEGEELPPLEVPKKGAPGAKGAGTAAAAAAQKGAVAGAAKGGAPAPATPAAKAPAAAAPVKGGAAAPAKAAVPAKAAEPVEAKKGSKAWLWWTTGLITLGGAGAAVAHFVFGVF